MKKANTQPLHKHWRCQKCNATYHSPIRVAAVMCVACSRSIGAREKWMSPDD